MSFDDFYDNKHIIDFIKDIKNKNKQLPNLMFIGDNNSGKSTLINILIKYLCIDRNDIIRPDISEIKISNIKNSNLYTFIKRKNKGYIIIDNYNKLSETHQMIIKSLIKNHNKNKVFIMELTNDINLLSQLSQYFIQFKMDIPKKNIIENYINKNNNINDTEIIDYIFDNIKNYGDIINISKLINLYMKSNKINIHILKKILNPEYMKIKQLIKNIYNKDYKNTIDNVYKLELNYDYDDLIYLLIDIIKKIDFLPEHIKIKYIEIILKYKIEMLYSKTHFLSMCFEMIGVS